MAEKRLYITRGEGEDLYTELQRRTRAELQRLSGEVWTDFNPGDPGVTVAEAADYALTEIDYKFGFPIADYPAGKEGAWQAERFGLFPPGAVYPTAPVTAEDYRRAILARFPQVEQVRVESDARMRRYDFRLRLAPFPEDAQAVCGRVTRFLEQHRNLCERIGTVRIEQCEALCFEADLEMEPGCDATDLLVEIYRTIQHYLAGSAELCRAERAGSLPMRPEEWYDGPVQEVRVELPEQCDTEEELYWTLRRLPGVVSFRSCRFTDRSGKTVRDFRAGYALQIPETFRQITVRIGEERAEPDVRLFRERLRAETFLRSTFRLRSLMREREKAEGTGETVGAAGTVGPDNVGGSAGRRAAAGTAYPGRCRNFSDHMPLADDLPACYAISERDFLRDTPAAERARIRNFGNYLKLFDLVLQRGLRELDALKEVLAIEETEAEPARTATLPAGVLPLRKTNDRFRPVAALRNRYMDFLDDLYGTESDPARLREFDWYGGTEEARLRRRMRFLRELPRLVRERAVSFDRNGAYGGRNVPVVKRILSLLLDFNGEEAIAVGNILPAHRLRLTETEHGRERPGAPADARMIEDALFAPGAVEAVAEDEPPRTNRERLVRVEELRRDLPIFRSNRIDGTLFREGIQLSRYNLVRLNEREWLLVFRGREMRCRLNLGRSESRELLGRLANTLCRYLRDLNRRCEAVYAVEKGLCGDAGSDTVLLVFTGWTARTRSPRFRERCTELARSFVPAHLKIETRWLGPQRMQYFEAYHRKWRECLRERAPDEQCALFQRRMMHTLDPDWAPAGERRGNAGENGDAGENGEKA